MKSTAHTSQQRGFVYASDLFDAPMHPGLSTDQAAQAAASDGPLAVDQAAVVEATGASLRTVSNALNLLARSGAADVQRGGHHDAGLGPSAPPLVTVQR